MGYPTQQQKLDYLFKKIGFSASKTGVAEDQTSGFSGDTKKAPPNEAIPSPLVIPASSLWADSSYIPATAPTSSNGYVGVYSTATAYRMTVDTSVSNNRAFVARSTWSNHSSAIDGDWIDTQFGADYLIKVYKGDPSVGAPGVAYTNITAAGTGAGPNDTWFFDYSSGVLNFNGADLDGQLVGINTDNVYIVGYRYLGTKGVQPAAGIGTFHNLYVSGISTFVGNAYANSEFHVGGTLSVTGISTFNDDVFIPDNKILRIGSSSDLQLYHTGSNSHVSDRGGVGNLHIESDNAVNIKQNDAEHYMAKFNQGGAVKLYHNNLLRFETTGIGATVFGRTETQSLVVSGFTTTGTLNVTGISTFTGAVSIGNSLSFGDSKFIYMGDGAPLEIGHYDGDGHSQIRHNSATKDLVLSADRLRIINRAQNKDLANFIEGSYTRLYFDGTERLSTSGIGATIYGQLDTTDLNVSGVSTFTGAIDANSTLEVAGIANFDSSVKVSDKIERLGDADTCIRFPAADTFAVETNGSERLRITSTGQLEARGAADVRLTLGSGGTVNTNDSVHVRADSADLKFMAANGGSTIFETNGTETFRLTANGGVLTGIATFTGAIDANGNLDVDGRSELDNVNIAETLNVVGVSTHNLGIEIPNDTYKLRTGTDLEMQVFHDGTNSTIKDTRNGGKVRIQADNFDVRDKDDSKTMIAAGVDGSVSLSHSGNERLKTTGTGVDITDDINVAGIATFSGTVSVASSTGVSGQVLQSTGVGVTWATQPQARSTVTFTATEGQTGFSFNYNVGYVDVFVNGIKLTGTDYTATNGTVVTLDTGCVVGDIVEIYSYNIVSGTVGGSGGATILNDLNDVSIVGTPVAGESIKYNGTKFTNDYTLSTTTSSTSQITLHSLSASTYRTVEWTIQATQGSNYHTTKILAVHNGSTVSHTEFATLVIGSSLATYTTDIGSGNIRLLVSPSSSSNTVFKTKFTMIKV